MHVRTQWNFRTKHLDIIIIIIHDIPALAPKHQLNLSLSAYVATNAVDLHS